MLAGETVLSFPQKPSDELPSLSLRLLSSNTDLPPKIRGSQLLLTERIVHEDHQRSVTAETKEEGDPKGETVREKPTGDRNEQLGVLPTLAPFSLS